MYIKDINRQLENIMEDFGYDAWLYQQADEYNDPHVTEITIKGHSYFKVQAKKPNGDVIELDKIPLEVHQTRDVTEEDERTGREYSRRWSAICDNLEDYFDIDDLDSFDTYVEDVPENELLPEKYELIKVLDFADEYSFEDLEVE